MNGLFIGIGMAVAGWFIAYGIEGLGNDLKGGLEALADAIRETEE